MDETQDLLTDGLRPIHFPDLLSASAQAPTSISKRKSNRRTLQAGDDYDTEDSEVILEPSSSKATSLPGDKTPTSHKVPHSLKRSAFEVLAPNAKKLKKRDRVPGGRTPTSKAIVPDYDSEDQIIVSMKQQGHADQEVVDRLVNEGRTKYDAKSICSRWQRIRRCLQAAEDELLDEDLTDWHEGEDDLLAESISRAKLREADEIARVKAKFYTFVAQEINKTAIRPRFSARACKERQEAIDAGTARCPPELDPDPEGRARERLERLANYKARKEQEAIDAREEAEARKKEKTANDREKEAARTKREANIEARNARKKEEEDFKSAKSSATAERRKLRKDAQDYQRALRLYHQRKLAAEKALHRSLQRQANQRARKLARFSMQFPLPKEAVSIATPVNQTVKQRTYRSVREEALSTMDFASEELALNERAKSIANTPARGRLAGGATPAQTPKTPISMASHESAIFGDQPRAMMTMAELYDLMRERGMLLGRMKEVKGVVLSRLNDEDIQTPFPDLQKILRERNLSNIGTKATLVRRLQEDDARNSASYIRRFADKPPAAEVAIANAAAAVANGGVARRGRKAHPKPKTPTAGRFTARPAPATPVPFGKRYSAREKTNQLLLAANKFPAARGDGGGTRTIGGSFGDVGARGGFSRGAQTPLHSYVPEPTYAPERMDEGYKERDDDADAESPIMHCQLARRARARRPRYANENSKAVNKTTNKGETVTKQNDHEKVGDGQAADEGQQDEHEHQDDL